MGREGRDYVSAQPAPSGFESDSVVGELNSPSGWWEGEEPNKEKAVTFQFCKPEDSEITGSNRTLSFYDYVQGDETGVAYLGEVAIWR